MPILRFARSSLAVTAAALLGFAASAQAESVALGSVSAPVLLSFGNDKLLGPFSDEFDFTIAPGKRFLFAASLSTGFSRIWNIVDMDAALYSGNRRVEQSIAQTIEIPFPSHDFGFPPIVLEAGDYRLTVVGNAIAFRPFVTAQYSGSIDIAAVRPAVPEPGTGLLMGVGLIAAGLLSRRRRA